MVAEQHNIKICTKKCLGSIVYICDGPDGCDRQINCIKIQVLVDL